MKKLIPVLTLILFAGIASAQGPPGGITPETKKTTMVISNAPKERFKERGFVESSAQFWTGVMVDYASSRNKLEAN